MTRRTVGTWHGGRYAALWHGGANYAMPSADDAEWFRSIREAIAEMRSRETMGYFVRHQFRTVFRGNEWALTPCAHDSGTGSIVLYRVPRDASADDIRTMIETGYPDYVIEYGPRGGISAHRA